LDGLLLFGLAGGVVGGGGETNGLPDGSNLGWSKVGLSDQWKIEGNSRKIQEASDLIGLRWSSVHSESKSVLVETLFKGGFGDDLLTGPQVFETNSGVLEQSEICVMKTREL